jgi:hypothetical protein
MDWNVISAVAASVSAFFASFAACVSVLALIRMKRSATEASAAEAVKLYIQMAIENPDVSTTNIRDKSQKEDWLVTFLLLTSREVLKAHKKDDYWREWIRGQLELYKETLIAWKRDDEKEKSKYLDSYGVDVSSLLKKICQ